MVEICDNIPIGGQRRSATDWRNVSLILVGISISFAVSAIVWHWYITTALPLAAAMRGFYQMVYPQPRWHLVAGLIDIVLPVLLFGVALGIAGGRQGRLFLLCHAFWLGAAIPVLLSVYHHWLPPADAAWLAHGWAWMAKAWLSAALVCLGVSVIFQRALGLPAGKMHWAPNLLSIGLRMLGAIERRSKGRKK